MNKTYLTNGKQLSFDKTHIVAIVNVTPDSFYDGGKYSSISDIIKDVEMKISDGATIIDIGAASSKPQAMGVSVKEELLRLKAPLSLLRNEFPKTLISADTYVAEVAKVAIDLGADIINDISGGEMDADMLPLIAKHDIPYILMHMQGTPEHMQKNPTYAHVTNEIKDFFKRKINTCEEIGLKKIILDVGFGFGKTVEHNFQLLKELNQFTDLGFPILAGLSRKSMISKVIHTLTKDALNGTTVLNTIALLNGAKLLRVHDVKEAKQAAELCEFYNNLKTN